MGRSKHDAKEAEKPEYQPIEWVQTSGFSVEDDAQWTAAITGRDPQEASERRRWEIQRLAHFHGKEYARKVEVRAREIFRARREKCEAKSS